MVALTGIPRPGWLPPSWEDSTKDKRMSVLTTTVAAEEFCRVRSQSLALCAPLTPEDMMVQSCADASPAKWHLAHTTWFFETFVLREFVPGYKPFHKDFIWLFNSYYNAVSEQPEKKLRASFSRPTSGGDSGVSGSRGLRRWRILRRARFRSRRANGSCWG